MGIDEGNSKNEKLNIYCFKKESTSKVDNKEQREDKNDSWDKNVEQLKLEYKNLNWISKGEHNDDNFKYLIEDIKKEIQKKHIYNCILIFFDSNDYKNKIEKIGKDLDENIKVYKPIVILVFDKKGEKDIKNENNLIEKKYEIVYTQNDYNEIFSKIKSVYKYYFNIGDHGFVDYIKLLNEFNSKNKKIPSEENINKYKATINILVMGRTGSGKSTLINLLLEEQRAREGLGYSITKLYSQYVHKKYPITFIDTLGFKDIESLKTMENFLSTYDEFFNEGKNKFHLVLYLLNAGSERTFSKAELNLINDIRNKYNLPIFFVCTHCRTGEDSEEFKEEVKISLIQYLEEKKAKKTKEDISEKNFAEERISSDNQNQKNKMNCHNKNNEKNLDNQNKEAKDDSTIKNQTEQNDSNDLKESEENISINPTVFNPKTTDEINKINKRIEEEKTELTNRIYCCNLVNSKDKKYKIFGIDKILSGIKIIFKNEIKEIKTIKDKIIKNQNTPELSAKEENEMKEKPSFNIMKSFEKSKSFSEYLKNLSLNIIKKYNNKISEIKEKNLGLDKIKKLSYSLKIQLSYEFNCDPSDFNTSKKNEKIENKSPISSKSTTTSEDDYWGVGGFFNILRYPFTNSNSEIQEETKNIEYIKKIVDEKCNDKEKDNIEIINSNMIQEIKSYDEAITGFDEMIEKFK